jgi:hypothetical protein
MSWEQFQADLKTQTDENLAKIKADINGTFDELVDDSDEKKEKVFLMIAYISREQKRRRDQLPE